MNKQRNILDYWEYVPNKINWFYINNSKRKYLNQLLERTKQHFQQIAKNNEKDTYFKE